MHVYCISWLSPVLSGLQCTPCELPQQYLPRYSPMIISSANGRMTLQFQRSRLKRLRQHDIIVKNGKQYTDSFTFRSSCNLTLNSYQLNARGYCVVTIFVSPSQHTRESSPIRLSGYYSTSCSYNGFCLIDWQAHITQQLDLSGKLVTIYLTNIKQRTCIVPSRWMNGKYEWDGVRLITKGRLFL